MGCFCSDDADSTRLNQLDVVDFKGPVEKRKCTDIQFSFLFAFFLAVWIGLVVYCAKHGNVSRVIHGFDDCGNVCGEKNEQLLKNCTPVDMTDKPLLLIHNRSYTQAYGIKKECVSDCNAYPNHIQILTRCVATADAQGNYQLLADKDLRDKFQETIEDIKICSFEIIYLCFIALVLSLLLMALFRYCASIIVWTLVIGAVAVCVCGTVYLWVMYSMEKDQNMTTLSEGEEPKSTATFKVAIVATIFTAIFLLIVYGMRKHIQLVTELFFESGKALYAMPVLIFQPFVTLIAMSVAVGMTLYFVCVIEGAGTPAFRPSGRVMFKKDEVMITARVFNWIALLWIITFITACQQMVIAGSVATWFFTRKKDQLKSPILTSYGYLLRYHLGTVAFGSLIITLFTLIRWSFNAIQEKMKRSQMQSVQAVYGCMHGVCECIQKLLEYLTRNAYIEVAIYGDNLWTSGKRASQVLFNNSLRVIAINSVGDFVLFLGKVLVVVITTLVGFQMLQGKENVHHIEIPLIIVTTFAYIVAHTFVTVYEMTIDTIFICFCEDCELNDGSSRPYYMNRGLMEFVERSQKTLRIGDADHSVIDGEMRRSEMAKWTNES